MKMKYYNSSNNFSAPIKREPKPYSPYVRTPEVIVPQRPYFGYDNTQALSQEQKKEFSIKKNNVNKKLNFNNLKADDLLLLGIIAVLIWNSCDDTLLILALGYLFIAGL